MEWLSDSIEALFDELSPERGPEPDCEALVVGSGYGGAVAALRLAQSGVKVWLLERGRERLPGEFPGDWGHLVGDLRIDSHGQAKVVGRPDALFDLRVGKDIAAVLGNALGGGSQINAGVVIKADPRVFNREPWPKAFRDNPAILEPYYARAHAMLAPVRHPDPLPPKSACLGRLAPHVEEYVAKHWSAGARVRLERPEIAVNFDKGKEKDNGHGVGQAACVGCGDCVTGCNYGAKNTLTMNYLPEAQRAGARLFTGATVLGVEPIVKRRRIERWRVHFRRTDEEKAAAPQARYIDARVVILAAGTFGSTEILLRSARQYPLLRLAPGLGRRFSCNGDLIAAAYDVDRPACESLGGVHDEAPVKPGPTITGMIDVRAAMHPARGMLIQDAVMPGPLVRLFGEVITTAAVPAQLIEKAFRGDTGARESDPLAVSAERLRKTQVYLAMGEDEASGVLRLEDALDADLARARCWVHWPGASRQSAYRGIETLLKLSRKLGGVYLDNPASKPFSDELAGVLTGPQPAGPAFTVHPLGGCAMADDVLHGVVDHAGRVFDAGIDTTASSAKAPAAAQESPPRLHDGLYVMDGAIVPTAIGANPLFTISALAERAVELLIEAHFPGRDPGKGKARPKPRVPEPQLARNAKVAFRFSERMDGELVGALAPLDGAARRPARLEIDYQVDDIDAWLKDPAHRSSSASGTLVLRSPGEHRAFALQGHLNVLVREPAPRWRRRLRALWTWFWKRGLREIWRRVRDGAPIDLKMGLLLWRIAPHIGERRFMRYEFDFETPDGPWHLAGTKTIEYSRDSNLWNSLCDLEVRLGPAKGARAAAHGVLSLDFVDLVRNRLPQIIHQSDEPSGVVALGSAALWVTRVMFQAHFWSFDAPDYEPREKFRRRYPAALADRSDGALLQPEQHWIVPGEKGAWQKLEPSARQGGPVLLSRYRNAATKDRSDAPPVLLVHGFAHSGLVFATERIDENLVQHLCERGFDVWVAELRTSIALESSWRQWSFDRIAAEDVPAAVDYVLRATTPPGRAPEEHRIKVVAHCMGSAVFSMASLAGWLEHADGSPKIEAAVLAQVAPLLRGSRSNELRANQAVFMRDALSLDHVSAAVDDSVDWRGAIADRIAMTYPLPRREARHHATRPCEVRTDLANCNRNSALFARQWLHANLDQRSHENLGELLAHANMTTFMQIAHFIELGRLVDAEGKNDYVRGRNIAQHMNFPILFLHAKDTDVFDPKTSRRSYQMFRRINTRTYYEHRLIPGHGHFDSLIGKRAPRDVFPSIAGFLEHERYPETTPRKPLPPLARPARLGPIVGWTRPDPRSQQPGAAVAAPLVRLWIKVDDSDVHPAKRVYVAVVRGSGQDWDPQRLVRASMRDWQVRRICGERIAVEDLALPDDRDDYWVLFASAHVPAHSGEHVPLDLALKLSSMQDLSGYVDAGALDFEFADIERKDVEPRLASLKPEQRKQFLAGLKKLGHALLRQWRSALATGEGAFLSRQMLQRVLHRQDEIALVFGSCRYPGSPFERARSDEIFRHILEKTVDAGPAPRPSVFLMVGDQIYADATAGMFDVAAPRERYVRAYDQAFGSPNLRALMRRIPTYMAADDHEIANDWEKWTPRGPRASAGDKDAALHYWADKAYRCHQWACSPRNAAGDGKALDGPLWYTFESAGFGFFAMDTRFERHRNPDSFPGQFIHPKQFSALKSWLQVQQRERGDRPKFVACGSVVAPVQRANAARNAYRRRDDSWYRNEAALNDLIGTIGDGRIENVVFLCGDLHASLATEMFYARNGASIAGLRSWCIVSSPFYAPLPFVNARLADYVQDSRADGKTQRDPLTGIEMDYIVRDGFEGDNFTRVHAFKEGGRWRLRVQFFDRNGSMQPEVVL